MVVLLDLTCRSLMDSLILLLELSPLSWWNLCWIIGQSSCSDVLAVAVRWVCGCQRLRLFFLLSLLSAGGGGANARIVLTIVCNAATGTSQHRYYHPCWFVSLLAFAIVLRRPRDERVRNYFVIGRKEFFVGWRIAENLNNARRLADRRYVQILKLPFLFSQQPNGTAIFFFWTQLVSRVDELYHWVMPTTGVSPSRFLSCFANREFEIHCKQPTAREEWKEKQRTSRTWTRVSTTRFFVGKCWCTSPSLNINIILGFRKSPLP